jgi:hypothetical protein
MAQRSVAAELPMVTGVLPASSTRGASIHTINAIRQANASKAIV